MSQPTPRQRLWDVVFLIILGLGIYVVALNRIAIADWWFFRSYTPNAAIAALATDAGLSLNGRQLLYRTDPQLVSRARLDQSCGRSVIGCITPEGKVYILQDQGGRFHNEIVVTAAHEMLHLAWRRLPDAERERLAVLLQSEQTRLNDSQLDQKITQAHDATEAVDELHSLLGSEYSNLSGELENYYGTYFTDRTKVTAAYRLSQ
ncbi:MAG TPA: hypothetical protein VK963_01200 [Candidatus Saccharimonadales bacterium]|nr:hypothetical protein [Candidatus Saccharimonadales bacterium]